jgi:outer membrane protein assembly factor BamB
MRNIWFFVSLWLFASCATHEGAISYRSDDHYNITSIQLKGAVYSTPVKITDNTLVVGTHRKSIYFLTTNDTVQTEHRKNLPVHTDETILNVYRAKAWIHATPEIVFDSLVSIGSYDGNMYFFKPDGELYMKKRLGGRIYTNPVQLNPDWIAFGLGKGLKYYNMQIDSVLFVRIKHLTHGSPTALNDGLLCIGGNDKTMHFFDKNGKEVSQFKTDGWIMHSKAMVQNDSVVVFGSYDKNLYSVTSSGKLMWKFSTDGRIHASPQQFSNGNIICGSFDKNIYLLSPQGEQVAVIPTGKRVVSSAAIYDDYAVIGSYDKNLYIINSSGQVVDKIYMEGKMFSSPIILDDGTIFCATTNGKAIFIKNN